MSWEDEVRAKKQLAEQSAQKIQQSVNDQRRAMRLFWSKLIKYNGQLPHDIRLKYGKAEVPGGEHQIGLGYSPFLGGDKLCLVMHDNRVFFGRLYGDGFKKEITVPVDSVNVLESRDNAVYVPSYHLGNRQSYRVNDDDVEIFMKNLCECNYSVRYDPGLFFKGIWEKAEPIKTKKCFIATACYGSYDAPEVLTLRQYRDQILEQTALGRVFVRLYYRLSPPVAKFIARRERLKGLIRHILSNFIVVQVRKHLGKD